MGLERFNYPDGTTTVAGITAVSNNLVINNNKAYISSAVPSNFFIFDDSVSNGVSEMFVEEPSASNKQYGFMARYVDVDNNWLITVSDGTSGRCRLIKKINGVNTVVAETNASSSYDTSRNKLRLEVSDAGISLFLNDDRVLSTDDDYLSGQGKSGFKMDDPSIAINWVSYQTVELQTVVQSGKALSASKLGQIVPIHSTMSAIGITKEYWPTVIRGDKVPNWPSTKYPLIMYSSPDHYDGEENSGIYVRVYNAELGGPTETAAWEEWQDVSNRSEFSHISTKTNPIFSESVATSETPSVIVSSGNVYLFTHNILNPGGNGSPDQGTSLAKGVNGIDFTSIASPLLSYNAAKEQGTMHTGYANIIENPIPTLPYQFIVNSGHGGGAIERGPTEAIWGTNDIEDPSAYKLITTFDRIREQALINGYTPAGWTGVLWVMMIHNIATIKKDGAYYRLALNLRKDVVSGGNGEPLMPIEVLVDENFNVVSKPNLFTSLGSTGEFDEWEMTHYSEVQYNGKIYGFYRGVDNTNSSSMGMLDVSEIDYNWEITHPRSNQTELLKANQGNYDAISATSSPTVNADGLMEFPLDASGNENKISLGTYTLSDYDVLEFKVKRQAQTGTQDIYGEIGFFDSVENPSQSFRFIWPDSNNALRFNLLANGTNEDFPESRKIVGNYGIYTADSDNEHYNSRIWYGIRVIPSLRLVQLLGGVNVINEYYLKDIDVDQPMNLLMKFSTPSGENTSMEVEEITVHSYSNEARGATTPTVNAGVNDAGLVGDTVQLNGTASDYDSLVWTCTSGQTPVFSDVTILNPTITFDEAGVHNLRLTATNAQGSTSDDVEFVITEEVDSTPPQITFEGGSTITLMVGDSYTPQVTAIDANDGTLTPTISNPVDTNTAGTYTVTATATDAAGNVGSATQTVIVEEVPVITPPTVVLGPNQSVDSGQTVYLDATQSTAGSHPIASYEWTQTAGDTVTLVSGNTASPSFIAPSENDAQTLTFSVVAIDTEGTRSTAKTVSITVAAFNFDGSILELIDSVAFELITDGNLMIYPGRANREIIKLRPSSELGLVVDDDGCIDFEAPANTISKLEVIIYNTSEKARIDSDTTAIVFEGPEAHCRFGDFQPKSAREPFDVAVVLYIEGDGRGVVVYSTSEALSTQGASPISAYVQANLGA